MDVEQNLFQYKAAMGLHTHQGFGLGVISTIPSTESVAEIIDGAGSFIGSTSQAVIKTYQQQMEEYQAMGTENSVIKGSESAGILSKTVFIGK